MRPETYIHVFDEGNPAAARGTAWVTWITVVMMVVEIFCGWWFHSMALLADGWHMSTHAVAIGLAALAYRAARRYARDPRFAFGTWKIEVLGGFASAIFLLGVAAMMVWESAGRLLSPVPIHYLDAMLIAAAGLVVNIVCALILGQSHDHGHDHGHAHTHDHGHAHNQAHGGHDHGDLNLKSAYIHVLADAGTSVLAIAALGGGMLWGWNWLDSVSGIVGAVVVALWAKNILSASSTILLDREMDHPIVDEVAEAVEIQHGGMGNRVTDLHVWRVGKRAFACAITLCTQNDALTPQDVRGWLAAYPEIAHATIEIHHEPR